MRGQPTVMHVDADAFFASVEQRQKPSLRGRPVLVGGTGPRAVVAAASYEARAFGVHSAQPMAQALHRCPQATVVATRMVAYRAHSAVLHEILRELSPLVDSVGLDEAYVDLAAGTFPGEPADAGRWVQHEMLRRTGLAVSVGAGRSKLTAKLASSHSKPHGLTVIAQDAEDDFLLPMPAAALPGVGPATAARLERRGVRTVADLRQLSEQALTRLLGTAHGIGLYLDARGQDTRPVEGNRRPKSIGTERTFPTDLAWDELASALNDLLARTLERLHVTGRAATSVTVKIRDTNFTTTTKTISLPTATSDPGPLADAADRALAAAKITDRVRLLGVALSGLSDAEQLTLDGSADGDRRPDTAEVTTPEFAPAVLTREMCRAGMDLEHDTLGAGWLVAVHGRRARVRFEGPDTPPARSDQVLDMTSGVLHTAPPPPPSGIGRDDDPAAAAPTIGSPGEPAASLGWVGIDQAPPDNAV